MALNRFSISAGGYSLGVWGFSLNPIHHTLRPAYNQNVLELIDGSVFILRPSVDSTILTLEWRNVPDETYGSFIHGKTNNLRFDSCFLYYISGSDSGSPYIVECTYESYTSDTINIPFIERGNNLEEVMINAYDRIFLGHSEQFSGILFDFEDYHSNQQDADGNSYIQQVDLRFSIAGGDLNSGDTITFDGTKNIEDDSTERLDHYGEMRWALAQVPNWGPASLNDILANTTGTDAFSTPYGFSSNDEYYYTEIKIIPDSIYTTLLSPKIQAIKVALDSIEAMSIPKSNGILPIWYINIPEDLKYHRPRGYRDSEWIAMKVVNYEAILANPTSVTWDVILSMVPIGEAEKRDYFILDVSQLDGRTFLS